MNGKLYISYNVALVLGDSSAEQCHDITTRYSHKDCGETRLYSYGFHISFEPQGSVFVFAELPKSWQISDVSSFYILNYC